nr:chorismate mutase [Paraphotobacterium marinum]
MSSELDTLRKEIDNCDSELLDILSKRYKAVEKIGQIKQTLGLPIYSPDREKKMFKSLKQMALQKKFPLI